MGSILSSGFRATNFLPFLIGFFVRPESLFLRPDPQYCKVGRAQELSRLAVALTFPRALRLPGHTLTAPSTVARSDGVGMTIRGEPAFECAYQSRHNLVFGGSKDPNHDAVMRIGGEAPRRRTHSFPRHKSHDTSRDPATSNRHRRPVTSGRTGPKLSGVFSDLRSLRRAQNDAIWHHALSHEPPQSDQKLARQGH